MPNGKFDWSPQLSDFAWPANTHSRRAQPVANVVRVPGNTGRRVPLAIHAATGIFVGKNAIGTLGPPPPSARRPPTVGAQRLLCFHGWVASRARAGLYMGSVNCQRTGKRQRRRALGAASGVYPMENVLVSGRVQAAGRVG